MFICAGHAFEIGSFRTGHGYHEYRINRVEPRARACNPHEAGRKSNPIVGNVQIGGTDSNLYVYYYRRVERSHAVSPSIIPILCKQSFLNAVNLFLTFLNVKFHSKVFAEAYTMYKAAT